MKQIRNKLRKTLQTVQLPADEQIHLGKSMSHPSDENLKEKATPSQKVVVQEKENTPIVRRSKRKAAISNILSTAKPTDKPETKKSNAKTLKGKSVSKTKKGGSSTTKKTEQKSSLNQTTLNFPTIANETTIISVPDIIEQPVEGKNILTSSTPTSNVAGDSGYDPGLGTSEQNTPCQSSEFPVTKNVVRYEDESYILTTDSPPLTYWRDLAEQRRYALEKALHENELLHDQLTVLEADNAQLKQLVKEAQELAAVVKSIIQ